MYCHISYLLVLYLPCFCVDLQLFLPNWYVRPVINCESGEKEMIETDKYDMILLLNSYRKCVSDQRKEKKKIKIFRYSPDP